MKTIIKFNLPIMLFETSIDIRSLSYIYFISFFIINSVNRKHIFYIRRLAHGYSGIRQLPDGKILTRLTGKGNINVAMVSGGFRRKVPGQLHERLLSCARHRNSSQTLICAERLSNPSADLPCGAFEFFLRPWLRFAECARGSRQIHYRPLPACGRLRLSNQNAFPEFFARVASAP